MRARTCISQHDMLWIGRSHVFADRYPRACRLRLFLSIFCCVLDFMHTSFTVLLLQHPPPPGLSFYSNAWDHENTVRDYFLYQWRLNRLELGVEMHPRDHENEHEK